jgi:hypothetical protein
MDSILQRAMEGGAVMSMDGRVDICSCNIHTSTFRGGRISQRAMEDYVVIAVQQSKRYASHYAKYISKNYTDNTDI